ncbi:peptidoglycan D,D-transpeptidase FtsI family protein, partial [Planctomycetota bacterium]
VEDELYDKLEVRRDKRFMWVKRFISSTEVEKVRELKIRGVVLEREYQRQYPMGQLAAHVIGYTTIDGEGLEGVEAGYDEYLRGQAGQWRLSSDALRRPIGSQEEHQPAKDGHIVVLSIDTMIQSYVEEQLALTVEKFGAQGATGIVMDPVTGEILAMANCPTFEPATARQSPAQLKRNRALTDKYEPGSTFKPFTLAAGLEGGYVTVGETIFCHNGHYEGGRFGKIGEYGTHGWGNLTAAEIIVYSSNIGAAKIAQKIGKKNFFPMIEKFGFGRRTGIDLAGEVSGTLRPLSQWDRGQYDLTRAAFGQGPIVVTPIQLMRTFCCLANGGYLVQPRIVKGILSPEGEIIHDFGAEAASAKLRSQRVISEKVSRQMVTEVLTAVVDRESGSAHNAYVEGYQVFGKTGTANMIKEDGSGYAEGKYLSSFMGGAPADNPRICVLVMVREPDQSLGLGYVGGLVAGPAVGEIIRQTLGYMGIPKRVIE